ncbi:MAG: hypothetical protein U1F54_07570 [Burkholderiales bacterium]
MRSPASLARTRIVVIGMNDRAFATLARLFMGPHWRDCELIGSGEPDMAIVDLDTPQPDVTWASFRARHPTLPTLVMSLRPQSREGARAIFKPVGEEALRKVITELKRDIVTGNLQRRKAHDDAAPAEAVPQKTAARPSRLPSTFAPIAQRPADEAPARSTGSAAAALDPEFDERHCGTAADVDLRSPDGLEGASYDPSRFFQGMFEQAISHVVKTGQPLAIDGLPAPFVIVPGARPRIDTHLRDAVLRSVCILPLKRGALRLRAAARTPEASDASLPTAESVLWQVALWTARGRLRRDVSPIVSAWLDHWPNFTRLVETPHAMRIAAVLASGARTPEEVCRDLRVAQRHVFSVLSAAAATGNLRAAGPVPLQAIPESTKAATPSRGVLARILGRLAAHLVP